MGGRYPPRSTIWSEVYSAVVHPCDSHHAFHDRLEAHINPVLIELESA